MRFSSTFLVVCLALCLVHATPTAAQVSSGPILEYGSLLGGTPNAVAVHDGYAYVAAGRVLNVLDASHMSSPRPLRSIQLMPWAGGETPSAVDIAVDESSGTLYVAMHNAGYWIYSTADPESPEVVSRRTSVAPVHGLTVTGGELHIFTDGVVERWSITTPANPSFVSVLDPATGPLGNRDSIDCFETVIADGLVYSMWVYAQWDLFIPQLRVFSTAPGPQVPLAEATYDWQASAGDVFVDGSTVYLATGSSTVYVSSFGILDGLQPVAESPIFAERIFKRGDQLHAVGSEHYRIYDVVDPQNPALLHEVDLVAGVDDLVVDGDRVWIAMRRGGIQVFDISSGGAPISIGLYRYPTTPYDIAMMGDQLVVADYAVTTLDIAPGPAIVDPVVVDHFPGTSSFEWLKAVSVASDQTVFVAGSILRVFDASVTGQAALVSQINFTGQEFDVTHRGDLVFAATTDGFAIADFEDRANPVLLNETFGGGGSALEVIDDRLYLPRNESGSGAVAVYDVSDPNLPTALGSVPSPVFGRDVQIDRRRLYVAGSGGAAIFDIAATYGDAPALLATIPSSGTMEAIHVYGDRLAVGDEDFVRLYDVSDPSQPVEIGYHQMPGPVESVLQYASLIYVGVRGTGVHTMLSSVPTSTPTLQGSSIAVSARPNPMSSEGTLSFRLGWNDDVRLEIYDLRGRLVQNWERAARADVPVAVHWNGRDHAGRTVASGTYLYRVVTSRETVSGRVVLMR